MHPAATEAAPATNGAVGETAPAPAPPRVIIEAVEPAIDGGRFPIKRTVGEEVTVSADVFADGHDVLAAVLRYRHLPSEEWVEVPMTGGGNDRWSARFLVTALGRYEYTVLAWVDRFATWRRDLSKKTAAGQDVSSELLEGAELVTQAAHRASGADADWLHQHEDALVRGGDPAARVRAALDSILATVMARYPDRSRAPSSPVLRVTVAVNGPALGRGTSCSPAPRRASRAGMALSGT
jgi:starch synthase (maltosyl-transferring)